MVEFAEEVAFITKSGMFDEVWYLSEYQDVATLGLNPIVHFLQIGARLGRNPSPRFDTRKYFELHPSLQDKEINPLLHFLNFKKREQSAVKTEIIASSSDTVFPEGYSQLSKNIKLVKRSGLFDEKWYLSEYVDVYDHGVDPVRHYLKSGAGELRNPSPHFNTAWYIQQNPDVRGKKINPLVHYILYGQKMGLRTSPEIEGNIWWKKYTPEEVDISSNDSYSKLVLDAKVEGFQFNPGKRVSIIIPIFNAPNELKACIASVVAHTKPPYRLLLVNDGSTDPAIASILKEAKVHPGAEVHENPENLGFTKTVNRAIDIAGDDDIVLLNSDTIVTPNWLRNLKLAAYSQANIGTVTPFSNNSGAFSAPLSGKDNVIPDMSRMDDYARAITQLSLKLYPEVPTGHGFCLYVRRDCLAAIGKLDEVAFPRGYGEENDLCMRAGKNGWLNIIDDASLIYHVRSASFKEEKHELMKLGRSVIDARYPDYSKAIKVFSTSEKIKLARERVGLAHDAVFLHHEKIKPRYLFVISTTTGGTPQTNQDLMSAIGDEVECFVLRCTRSRISLSQFSNGAYTILEYGYLDEHLSGLPHINEQYDRIVQSWLIKYSFELAHIRHIGWHSLGLIKAIKSISVPVVFSFHDFYTVCPTIKLLDENNVFCGGQCTSTKGDCSVELWPQKDFGRLKNGSIADWKAMFLESMQLCDSFVTTSDYAKEVMVNNYSFLAQKPFYVIAHGRSFDVFQQQNWKSRDEPLRLLFPGNISKAKGAAVINELAEQSADLDIEIHILGNADRSILNSSAIVFHGSYAREQFFQKIGVIKPHLGGIFSIWPETYCHTLTELWACGVPVIAFDIGAVGERISEDGGGWLVKNFTATGVIEQLNVIRRDLNAIQEKRDEVERWQRKVGKYYDCDAMAECYLDVYNSL